LNSRRLVALEEFNVPSFGSVSPYKLLSDDRSSFVGFDLLEQRFYFRSTKGYHKPMTADQVSIFEALCDTHLYFWKAPLLARDTFMKKNYYVSLNNIPDILTALVLSSAYEVGWDKLNETTSLIRIRRREGIGSLPSLPITNEFVVRDYIYVTDSATIRSRLIEPSEKAVLPLWKSLIEEIDEDGETEQ